MSSCCRIFHRRFEVDDYDASSSTIGWTKGGFQGARGNNNGAEWYVENAFELLDAPNEFFYHELSSSLYYFYNGTGAPPADLLFEVPTLQTIKSIQGTQQQPVKSVSVKGVTFKDSAYTYMEPHGVPSVRPHCPSPAQGRLTDSPLRFCLALTEKTWGRAGWGLGSGPLRRHLPTGHRGRGY